MTQKQDLEVNAVLREREREAFKAIRGVKGGMGCKGSFWGDGNVLYHEWGWGFMVPYIC